MVSRTILSQAMKVARGLLYEGAAERIEAVSKSSALRDSIPAREYAGVSLLIAVVMAEAVAVVDKWCRSPKVQSSGIQQPEQARIRK